MRERSLLRVSARTDHLPLNIKKERTQTMTSLPRLLLFSFLLALFAIGCTVQPGNSNAPVTTATPTASPTASPTPSSSPAATEGSMQITLPLLNALLADEAFVREAKSKVKLS